MGLLLYIIIIIINLLFLFNQKNNKGIIIFSVICMFLFYAFNTYNADLANYEYHFKEYVNGEILRIRPEMLYQVLLYIIANITSDFHLYMVFTGIFLIILMKKIYDEINRDINLHNFIFLIFLYPLFPYFTQTRSFIGAVILSIFIIRYAKSKNVKDFIIGVIIASLFHISNLIFLPFIFYRKLDRERGDGKYSMRRMYRIYGIMIAVSLIFCFCSPIGLIDLFSKNISKYGGTRFAYIVEDLNISIRWYVRVLYIMILVVETGITYIAYRNFIIKSSNLDVNHLISVIYEVNLYSAFIIPAIFLTTQAERYFRYVFVLNCITWSAYVKRINVRQKKGFVLLELGIGLLIFYFFIYKNREMLDGAFLPFVYKNNIWGNN